MEWRRHDRLESLSHYALQKITYIVRVYISGITVNSKSYVGTISQLRTILLRSQILFKDE